MSNIIKKINIKKASTIITLIALIVYLGACIYLSLFQEKILFTKQFSTNPIIFKQENIQDITLTTQDNTILEGKYKISSKDAPLIIFFSGNKHNSAYMLKHIPNINKYNILTFNYRGYGASQGNPSEKDILKDALEIYDEFHTKNTILLGRSLGSSVATYVASKREAKGLILLTPFDSVLALAQGQYPIMPISYILRHTFKTIDFMQNITMPTIVFEVTNDETVPKENFERLKNKITNLVMHEVFNTSTHGNFIKDSTFEPRLQNALNLLTNK